MLRISATWGGVWGPKIGYSGRRQSVQLVQRTTIKGCYSTNAMSPLKTPSAPETIPVRTRSFLLDPPRKPPLKRNPTTKVLPPHVTEFERRMASNPYAAILATPIRQCLYTRKLVPSAFLTKLIPAAPDSQDDGDQTWIVPERIIPLQILKQVVPTQTSPRSALGKWVYSERNVVESMIQEGKYKIMNPLAFIRQDLASLIYAHWSIRAAFEFVHLGKQGLKHFENVSQSSSASEGGRESLAVYKASTKNRLQCVLYFGSSADVDVAKPEDETTEKRDIVSQNRCSSINISQPGLPDPMDRSSVMHTAQVLEKDGGLFSVPVYDMDQLFHNHPQGLKAIQQQCHRQFPDLNYPSWIGLVESRYSVQAALGLWKLASILPNSGQKK